MQSSILLFLTEYCSLEVDAAFLVQMYCAFSKKPCAQGWDIDMCRRIFIFLVILDKISSNFIKSVQNIRSSARECHNIGLSVDVGEVSKGYVRRHCFSLRQVSKGYVRRHCFSLRQVSKGYVRRHCFSLRQVSKGYVRRHCFSLRQVSKGYVRRHCFSLRQVSKGYVRRHCFSLRQVSKGYVRRHCFSLRQVGWYATGGVPCSEIDNTDLV